MFDYITVELVGGKTKEPPPLVVDKIIIQYNNSILYSARIYQQGTQALSIYKLSER